MRSNYETYLKKCAKAVVPSFANISLSKIKVLSNSERYPDSIIVSMDVYAMYTDGYVLNNVATGKHYALTAVEFSGILNDMISSKRTWKPTRGEALSRDLLRVTFDLLEPYEFFTENNESVNNRYCKSLYESIMKSIAVLVKKALNESVNSSILQKFFKDHGGLLNNQYDKDNNYEMLGDITDRDIVYYKIFDNSCFYKKNGNAEFNKQYQDICDLYDYPEDHDYVITYFIASDYAFIIVVLSNKNRKFLSVNHKRSAIDYGMHTPGWSSKRDSRKNNKYLGLPDGKDVYNYHVKGPKGDDYDNYTSDDYRN